MNPVEKALKAGHVHHVEGRLEAAETSYREALRLEPGQADALHLLGLVLLSRKCLQEAGSLLLRCVELHPSFAAAWNSLGSCRREAGDLEGAEQAHRRALALNPADPEALNNLGIVLKARLRMAEALAAYEQALRLKPDFPEALNNLGSAYNTLCRYDEAIDCYRRALALKPDYAKAHFNESAARLVRGEWRLGWVKYEFRWASVQRGSLRPFKQPFWRGDSPIEGKTILLHAEQGLGDTLQFSRFVPTLVSRGAKVVLEVQSPLGDLCRHSYPEASQVLTQGEALPDFDLHCPLMSLPFALRLEESGIPRRIPYLSASAQSIETWNTRLGPRRLPRVGFAWAGNCKNSDDRNRSLSLDDFRPLLACPGFQFVCLQKDRSPADAAALAQLPGVLDPTRELGSFLDTAALVSNLDLVLTVDTSVAHLTGALGVPVWILLQFSPDWRWLLARNDSPWYPSARLFRQPALGDWAGALAGLRQALLDFRPDQKA